MKIKSSTLLIASVLALTASTMVNASPIFSDTFNGSSNTVGNGWTESPSSNVSRDHNALLLEGDAAASRIINTGNVLNLTLAFDWKPLEDSNNGDLLNVSWRKNSTSSWIDLFTGNSALYLGGSSSQFVHATKNIILASATSLFELRFWTDVHGQSDDDQSKGAYVDNVVLNSAASANGASANSISNVPEPASLLMLGLGLLGFEGFRRRSV